jgi:large subunit ribosomal protein L23
VFKVAPRANKIQIKKAIEKYFKVKVQAVNTMNYAGKSGNSRMRGNTGRRANWKKAVVTLREGETIDLM